MTINHDEQQLAELLNETANVNLLSEEQTNIFNAKFTQLFSQRLVEDVKHDIKSGSFVGGGSDLHKHEYRNLGMDALLGESLIDKS